MNKQKRMLLTGAVVVLAVVLVLFKYWGHLTNPWTRDGQVRAKVVQIAPRVSGPIVKLPIRDNQFVEAGDVLFEIDPRTFAVSLEQAQANLDQSGNNVTVMVSQVEAAKAAVEAARAAIDQAESSINEIDAQIVKNKANYLRMQGLLPKRAASERSVESARATYKSSLEKRRSSVAGVAKAKADYAQSEASLAEAVAQLGAEGDDNASFRAALAALHQAQLDLEFTTVRAPVSGHVTNLNLRLGSQAVANQPMLALVDASSYWVHGFFKENSIANIKAGDKAVVTLMTYPRRPLKGQVDSIGWGISQQDGSTGFDLLPAISPTFEWIRLAQRVPVRVHLLEVPDDIALRVGTTASVLVRD
jgi:multidrug resistance efflux pump